jgi:hypothetical protein
LGNGAEIEAVVPVGDGDVKPSGFATVAPCEAPAVGLAAFAVEVVGECDPNGLATVATGAAAGVAAAGGATVADSTLAVTFGDPAELVVTPEGGFAAELVSVSEGFALAAVLGPVVIVVPPELPAAIPAPAPAFAVDDAMLTVMEDGGFALGGALEGGVVFTTRADPFGWAELGADCAF